MVITKYTKDRLQLAAVHIVKGTPPGEESTVPSCYFTGITHQF
jgi:hypothetical protein